MNFYEYRQNNSGGSFDMDLGENVYVQANDAEEANSIALNNGIYFDGVYYERDCACCGDRWYEADNHNMTPLERIFTKIKKILSGEHGKIAIIFNDEEIISFEENDPNNQSNLDIFLERTK